MNPTNSSICYLGFCTSPLQEGLLPFVVFFGSYIITSFSNQISARQKWRVLASRCRIRIMEKWQAIAHLTERLPAQTLFLYRFFSLRVLKANSYQ